MAHAAKADPSEWLAMDDVYGDVGKSPVMQTAFAKALKALWQNGSAATLDAYVRG